MPKIVTYNVNGIKARMERLLEYLAEQQPDVVCLQELKGADETLPVKDIEAAGYGAVWHGQKGFNGVAVLAKGQQPVERQRGLAGDPEDAHSRYLEAEIGDLIVASIYLPNGNPQPGPKFDYKLDWFARLRRHASSFIRQDLPVVLAGDYNVAPTEIDIYPTRSWDKDALIQPKSRAAFASLVEQGWCDAIRELHPDKRVYTFWDYKRNRWPRDAGLRLDHLLLSPALATQLKKAGVDRHVRGEEGASDHAPAWVVLK